MAELTSKGLQFTLVEVLRSTQKDVVMESRVVLESVAALPRLMRRALVISSGPPSEAYPM
jgi:hypothetical protein